MELEHKRQGTFSTVRADDLERAGIVGRYLWFNSATITESLQGFTSVANTEIVDLHSHLKKIYARVNMDHYAGPQMILDAVLLSLTEIASVGQRSATILQGLKVPSTDGVQVTHPVSGSELWLSGNVDYVVIEYDDIEDNRELLLAPVGPRFDPFSISKGRLLLVGAKRQSQSQEFTAHVPKAVSQAIALLKSENLPEVRFCLSDGQSWMFFILKAEEGTLTYYESTALRMAYSTLTSRCVRFYCLFVNGFGPLSLACISWENPSENTYVQATRHFYPTAMHYMHP
ncbi:hypothetical protein D9619_001348 [Psilocybe cf. subviscida]|uniref:Uncharacterized protein n=1 Tax=Psilocybe cf. subviscida TaxID=2480587 RepID=A0A8H5BFW0_9AGAR|nr:hypothetical protein D9619_001348 [Psilocybe cf. subviscida]